MNRLCKLLILSTVITLSACSTGPEVGTQKVTEPTAASKPNPATKPSVPAPVKPSRPPVLSELVGKYSLFAGSEISFGINEQGGKLFVSTLGQTSELEQVSATNFKLAGGREVNFDYSREGKYDRFRTESDGRTQLFIRNESLERGRKGVTKQAVYTWQLVNALKPGGYTYSRFMSPSRGLVDYSVYLPPDWKRDSKKTYPLVFFLHGQTGWERSFPDSVPAKQLNDWIAKKFIPPMVVVSLRTGRLNGKEEEQWSSARNETLLTSEKPEELRAFVREQFRAGMTPEMTAIHGHSRGSRGAIHYALKYPTSFSSAVANAFVSDYALQETMQIASQNLPQIRSEGIPLRISIGDRDEFALNMGRRASPIIHRFLNNLQIPHEYEVFPGVDHGFVNVWNTKQKSGLPNGLAELQFHAGAWAAGSNAKQVVATAKP